MNIQIGLNYNGSQITYQGYTFDCGKTINSIDEAIIEAEKETLTSRYIKYFIDKLYNYPHILQSESSVNDKKVFIYDNNVMVYEQWIPFEYDKNGNQIMDTEGFPLLKTINSSAILPNDYVAVKS